MYLQTSYLNAFLTGLFLPWLQTRARSYPSGYLAKQQPSTRPQFTVPQQIKQINAKASTSKWVS